MAAESAFWDRLADRYAAQPLNDPGAYETKLAAIRRLMHPETKVFEFGCGTGSTALALAPHARHIRAIDYSARMIDIARAKAEKAGVSNVSFELGKIEDAALEAESLDMVMGHSILHLLKNKSKAIAMSYAALKPGGYFITSTACLTDFMAWFRFVAPIGSGLRLMPHVDVMSSAQLLGAVQKPGFLIEHQWQPSRKAAFFVIARKPERKVLGR